MSLRQKLAIDELLKQATYTVHVLRSFTGLLALIKELFCLFAFFEAFLQLENSDQPVASPAENLLCYDLRRTKNEI